MPSVASSRSHQRNQLPKRELWIGGGAATRSGVGKLREEDDFRPDNEVNQDRHLFLWSKKSEAARNTAIGVIVDGISNCRYGSGSRAAEIACNELEKCADKKTIRGLRYNFEKANEAIVVEATEAWKAADTEALQTSELMGAAAAVCVVNENRAIIVACGDVRVYLWSEVDGLMLLNHEQNCLNGWLATGESWLEASSREDGLALASYLGLAVLKDNEAVVGEPDFVTLEVNLRPGELILLATDGLTDCLNRSTVKGRFDADRALEQIVTESLSRKRSVKCLVDRLADEANRNGGGDNITVVAMRADEPASHAALSRTKHASKS